MVHFLFFKYSVKFVKKKKRGEGRKETELILSNWLKTQQRRKC